MSISLSAILELWIKHPPIASPAVDCRACPRPVKCCDFQPFVANFILGALLERHQILPTAPADVCLSPIGATATADFRARHARGEPNVCAFLRRGRCSIWWARPGECSTYTCATSLKARDALSARAFAVEVAVAQMALAEQGYTSDELDTQVDIVNGGGGVRSLGPPLDVYRRAWEWAKTLTEREVAALLEDRWAPANVAKK